MRRNVEAVRDMNEILRDMEEVASGNNETLRDIVETISGNKETLREIVEAISGNEETLREVVEAMSGNVEIVPFLFKRMFPVKEITTGFVQIMLVTFSCIITYYKTVKYNYYVKSRKT
ncbi:MAG: hypothetical protein ABI855_07935 [Bacteroidota bacterium]